MRSVSRSNAIEQPVKLSSRGASVRVQKHGHLDGLLNTPIITIVALVNTFKAAVVKRMPMQITWYIKFMPTLQVGHMAIAVQLNFKFIGKHTK